MIGDVLAGVAVLAGFLLIVMGISGSYIQLEQFGLKFPGGTDLGMNWRSVPGGPTTSTSTGGATPPATRQPKPGATPVPNSGLVGTTFTGL